MLVGGESTLSRLFLFLMCKMKRYQVISDVHVHNIYINTICISARCTTTSTEWQALEISSMNAVGFRLFCYFNGFGSDSFCKWIAFYAKTFQYACIVWNESTHFPTHLFRLKMIFSIHFFVLSLFHLSKLLNFSIVTLNFQ